MDGALDKNCWRCRGRRVICSRDSPQCLQCVAAGVECPGYGASKPVRFKLPVNTIDPTKKRPYRKTKQDKKKTVQRIQDQDCSGTCSLQNTLVRQVKLPKELLHLAEAIEAQNVVRNSWYANTYLEGNMFHFRIASMANVPPARQQFLILRSVSFRLASADSHTDPAYIRELRILGHKHIGLALACVKDEIADYERHRKPAQRIQAVISVFSVALADVLMSMDPSWRPHFSIFRQLLDDSGGFVKVYESFPELRAQLIPYIYTCIVANTTSPSHDLLEPQSHADMLPWLVEQGWEYPPFICPPSLLAVLVRINLVRSRLSTTSCEPNEIQPEVNAIFSLLDDFCPLAWTNQKKTKFHTLWLQMTNLYYSATTIYALSTLPSPTSQLRGSTSRLEGLGAHGSKIAQVLSEISQDILVQYAFFWPVVILGVHAFTGAHKTLVRNKLVDISRVCGKMSPMVAKRVLEEYWRSDRGGWDECFRKPYSFLS